VDELHEIAEKDLQQRIEYTTKLTKSGNPELRMRAENQLEILLSRAVFGDQ
jgi:hypothetical protein